MYRFHKPGLILLLSATLIACQKQEAPLPKEKMEAILGDMLLAESYSTLSQPETNPGGRITGPKNMDTLQLYYKKIFTRHEISSETFNKAYEWYTKHPKDLSEIYKNISDKTEPKNQEGTPEVKPEVIQELQHENARRAAEIVPEK